METNKKAVVLLSGGLDSATCLFLAKKQYPDIYTVSFDYGQRHNIELEASAALSKEAGAKKHFLMRMNLNEIGHSALTDDIPVPKGGLDLDKEGVIPVTYVPARNMIFLSVASAVAESVRAEAIFIGVNALDYSGYPDCRPDFIDSFQKTVNLATKAGREGHTLEIMTPLLRKTKAEIAKLANELSVPLDKTWSCYDPVLRNGKYVPCGECDSCILRAEGFRKAGIKDPQRRADL